jgi:tripartite-type tricarboxylate transporter receptor subunit TctC
MRKETKIILVTVGIVVWLAFLFQNIDSALAKDPEYPVKTITCYIPFGAGGTTNMGSRAFVEAASKFLGQRIIPVDRPGAGGTLAAMAVLSAKPDGYTLGIATGSNIFAAPFSGDSPYKDLSGFTMIVNFGRHIFGYMVRGDAPYRDWKEFIEWAKKNPRGVKIGLAGARSVSIAGVPLYLVEKREHFEFTYLSFKSSAEILTALLGGHINGYASTIDASILEFVQAGKIRILAYMGAEKVPGYENINSYHELYGFSMPVMFGIIGQKGMPENVLRILDGAFAKAVVDPDFLKVMDRIQTPVSYMDRGQITKYVEETFTKVGEIVKALKAEEAKERK